MMAKTAPRPDLIVLQPTPFCNISCSYCYLRDRDQPITMQPDTVRRIFQALGELVDLPSSIEVLWHAGEPMVLGPSWYRRSFDIIANSAPSQLTIHHGMQTNGTLISPEWCDTIAEHRIGLGVSIDGPEDIQNACRRTRKGSGTYKRLMAGLELLTHRKIEFGAICVITEHSVDKPQELFEFFCKIGVRRIGFNCEEVKGENRHSSMSVPSRLERYKSFLRRFCDLARSSNEVWSVRDMNEITAVLLGTRERPKYYAVHTTGVILSFTHDGNVSTYSPELLNAKHETYDNFSLGNVHKSSLTDLLSSAKAIEMARAIAAGIEKCRSECSYFALCGGGDPSSKIFENGGFESSETYFCGTTVKVPADLILGELGDDIAACGPGDRP